MVLQENCGILGEGDRPLDAVGLHGAERVFALRLDVAEGDVELVRRGLRREPVQPLDHAATLRAGVAEDRGAAADAGVEPADLAACGGAR